MKKLISIIICVLMSVICFGQVLADTPTQVDFLVGGATDSSGDPLTGGKVYTYQAGTTTPKATYQDSAKSTPHPNPVVLDAEGKKLVFADGNYKFRIDNSLDVTQYTLDNLKFGQFGGNSVWGGAAGGTANAITVTLSPALLALNAGTIVNFVASNTNTSATTTLSVNGLTATNIRRGSGEALQPKDIVAGNVYSVIYDTTNSYFYLLNPDGGWTDWTPALTADGLMTYTSTSISYAQYRQVGKIVFYRCGFAGTVGGTPTAKLMFSLPVTSAANTVTGAGYLQDNGALAGGIFYPESASQVGVSRYNAANFTAGTVQVRAFGFYEAQ
jgi:hypothetical protein